MRHTLSITVENRCGELARIVNLVSGRGMNIESLSVSETLETGVSKATLTLFGEEQQIELLLKQLSRQVRVLSVCDMNNIQHFEREMTFVSVNTPEEFSRQEILQLAALFRAEVVDANQNAITLQVFGERNKIDWMLEQLKKFEISECIRTGTVAVPKLRGEI